MSDQSDRMSTKRKSRLIFIIVTIVTISILLVAGISIMKILFAESLYTHKGSFAYYIAIPSLIKEVPEIDSINKPVYYSSVGDGVKPPQYEVTYQTIGQCKDILEKLEAYFIKHGFKKNPESAELNIALSNTMSVVHISVKSKGHKMMKVRVTQTY